MRGIYMDDDQRLELIRLLERAANLISLPAHPETWPSWMTQEKRRSMADNFRKDANEIKVHIIERAHRAVPQ